MCVTYFSRTLEKDVQVKQTHCLEVKSLRDQTSTDI